METQAQEYSLSWKGHAKHLQNSFTVLLENGHLCDVTLLVGRGKIEAHKVILSSCSDYFKQVFNDINDPHPIIILKDIPYDILKRILNFIYYGQVSVEIDELDEFLEAAEFLSIGGLMKNNLERKRSYSSINEMDNASNTLDLALDNTVKKDLLKKTEDHMNDTEGCSSLKNPIMPDSLTKLENSTSLSRSRTQMKEKAIFGMWHKHSYNKKRKVKSSPDLQHVTELDSLVQEDFGDCIDAELDLLDATDDDYSVEKKLMQTHLASNTEEGFRCNICQKTYRKKDSLKKHFAVHIENTTCAICGLTLSRRTHLKRHILKMHKKKI